MSGQSPGGAGARPAASPGMGPRPGGPMGGMGLGIDRLIIATNANDILARTLATGRYETNGVSATQSPSMDIQISSNFERLVFEALGRDVTPVQYAILRMLQERPGIDQVTLAGEVALDNSTTADICARLEAKGWILREVLPNALPPVIVYASVVMAVAMFCNITVFPVRGGATIRAR